jgi:hypothetical protein
MGKDFYEQGGHHLIKNNRIAVIAASIFWLAKGEIPTGAYR